MVGVAGELGAHLSIPTSLWSVLLRLCQVCRNHWGGGPLLLSGRACSRVLRALKLFIFPLTGAKQKEPETEWPLWTDKPLYKNLNQDAGSRFASWTLTTTEERKMAKNVYQALVMGVSSGDVETKHKQRKDCMCVKIRACIKRLFSALGLKVFECCMSFKCTVSWNVWSFFISKNSLVCNRSRDIRRVYGIFRSSALCQNSARCRHYCPSQRERGLVWTDTELMCERLWIFTKSVCFH